jgi:hypothetical protein
MFRLCSLCAIDATFLLFTDTASAFNVYYALFAHIFTMFFSDISVHEYN